MPLAGCGSCRTGVLLGSAFTIVGSSTSVTFPASGSFLGFQVAFQGAVLNQTGGCPAAVFGAEFTVSDTLAIQVR